MKLPQRPDRRDFLKASIAAGGGLLASRLTGGLQPQSLFASDQQDAPPRKLRLLILGGTGFIGPVMAELAVSRGHHVTLFNRGRRERFLGSADGTEKLYGNRDPNLHALTKDVDGKQVPDESSPKGLSELEGKTWDAVIDNSGYVPRIVKASAELLAPNVEQYLFISTVAVYANDGPPGLDERTAPLATISDPTSENISAHYGALKVLCEQAAEAALPGRMTIIRPGYIVGPGDTTDRFTYWPIRTTRGGEVLVPGDPDEPVQFIDVRDLAAFTIRCVEQKTFGIFNATGPQQRQTVGDVMAACLTASKLQGQSADATFTHVPYNWLADHGCPMGSLPIFMPQDGVRTGFHLRNIEQALAAGLQHRNVVETCSDLIQWWPEEVALRKKVNEERKAQGLSAASASAVGNLKAGISAREESRLLAAWHQQENR